MHALERDHAHRFTYAHTQTRARACLCCQCVFMYVCVCVCVRVCVYTQENMEEHLHATRSGVPMLMAQRRVLSEDYFKLIEAVE